MKDTTQTNELTKGSIVNYNGVHYRISRLGLTTVNLVGVWDGKMRHKKIALSEVFEDGTTFYDDWSKSETYKCR